MAMMTLSALAFAGMVLALSVRASASVMVGRLAALAALAVASGYLLLSGASVSTQRAYVMIALALLALAVGRRALTVRGVAVAALVVLLIDPASLLGPSFQMSFAATLALVAGYAAIGRSSLLWRLRERSRALPPALRTATWPLRVVGSIALTSLIAGLATGPFAAYHFSVGAPYGLLGNVLALPVVSTLVMPAGLLALLATPFGLEGWPLAAMAAGIDQVLAIARWLAAFEGSRLAIPAIRPEAIGAFAAAGCLAVLLTGRARLLAGVPLLVILVTGVFQPVPAVLVERDGRMVGLVLHDDAGTRWLDVSRPRRARFSAERWAERLAIGPDRAPHPTGWLCDGLGCAARLPAGGIVALVEDIAAFEEDCRLATVIVSPLAAPPGCAAPVIIDGPLLERAGAVALVPDAAAPAGLRPWHTYPGRHRPWQGG